VSEAAAKRVAIPWPVVAVTLGVPLLLLAALELVHFDVAPGEKFTGYLRHDLLYYSANAREVFENGNGLLYGDPFSASFETPRVFSHLQLLMLGWAWRVTGVDMPVLWQAAQLISGVAMFAALYALLGCFFRGRKLVYAFLVAALGGGATALLATYRTLLGSDSLSLTQHFERLVSGPAGPAWTPNVFQNALFTTEAFYHALAFATFAAALRGRHGLALLGLFLVWWSHPFTGLEVTAIVGAFAALEFAIGRERRMFFFASGVAVIGGLFLAYYMLLLPSWSPEAAEILVRWRRAALVFRLVEAPLMWGIFLLGLGFALLPKIPVLDLPGEASDRFLVIWLLVVGALLLHDMVLPGGVYPYQPIHFSHGYFFLPLAILTLRGGAWMLRSWPARSRAIAAAAFLLFVSFDNVLFTAFAATTEQKPVLAADELEVSTYLAAQPPPSLVLLGSGFPTLREYLSVATPHRVYNFSRLQTPYYEDKMEAAKTMLASPSPAQSGALLGIHWVVGSDIVKGFGRDIRTGKARLALRSGRLEVVEILSPTLPQRPDRPSRLPGQAEPSKAGGGPSS
jgi:hypothetical protein